MGGVPIKKRSETLIRFLVMYYGLAEVWIKKIIEKKY